MIDIYFDKLYRYPRIQECVSIAVPFKKGELKDISEVAVLQNGRECVIQPRVTAWHNDGSVKYLFISFMADIPANKRAKLILVTDKKEYDDGIKASIQCQSIISTDNKMQHMYTELEAARVSVEKTKKAIKSIVVQSGMKLQMIQKVYSQMYMMEEKRTQKLTLKVLFLKIKMAMTISCL